MRFKFKKKWIERLYYEDKRPSHLSPHVIEAFYDVTAVIGAAEDERDLRGIKSLHFEKLKGKRGKASQRSLRLAEQFRLIVTLERDDEGRFVYILDIVDYH